jgi:UDP-N-acetylmuramate dehydrogenase
MTTAFAHFASLVSPGQAHSNVLLSKLGRWRIGGPADMLVEPTNRTELAAVLSAIAADDIPHIIVGDSSNLLYDDAGLRGVVVKIGRHFAGFRHDSNGQVTAGAGLWVPSFVRRVIAAGLSGCVHAIGIPGTLGGLVTMNGGSQRKGIGDRLIAATVTNYRGQISRLSHAQLGFGYRSSALQAGGEIMLEGSFRYTPSDKVALHHEALTILRNRRRKFPKIRANCGSVFVSDPALYDLIGPPGAAIERVGLKGKRIGDAQLSLEHANFIVNLGRARASDVLALIRLARAKVKQVSGIAMLAEVRHVLPDGRMQPAHVSADSLPLPVAD